MHSQHSRDLSEWHDLMESLQKFLIDISQCTCVLVVFVLLDRLSDFRHGLTFDAEVFLDSANEIQYLRMISGPPFIAYVVIRTPGFLSDDIPITQSFAYFMKHWKIRVRDQEDECQSS